MQVSTPTYSVGNIRHVLLSDTRVEAVPLMIMHSKLCIVCVRSHTCIAPLQPTHFERFGNSWMSLLGKNVDTSWKQTCECFFKGMDSLQILCPSNPMWKNTFQKQFKRGVIYPWPIMCNVHSQSCPAQSISLWCPKALKATVLTTVAMKSCSYAGAILQALKQDTFAMVTQCWLACLCRVPRRF